MCIRDRSTWEEAQINGTYPRYVALIILNECTASISKNRDQTLLDTLKKLTLQLLDENFDKKFDAIAMPYSELHRKKIHIWQALCVVSRLFRETKDLPQDFMKQVHEKLWKNVALNNLPSVRQYIEIFAITFFESQPELAIATFRDCLQNKAMKAQFAISVNFMVGYMLCYSDVKEELKPLFSKYLPYVSSNTAYIRSIAQFFTSEFIKHNKKDPKFLENNNLLQEIDFFFNNNKDVLNMKEKLRDLIEIYDKFRRTLDINLILNTKMDDMGEALHDHILEQVRAPCIELLQKIRDVSNLRNSSVFNFKFNRTIVHLQEKMRSGRLSWLGIWIL
eukprot:TRINITY_DN7418_c0_g1_i2.p1 TRINITY_DN7418_c0_g1~~TRINITY_DN7418_c0_g1_i2.p1  ORF type:complete len:334 (+),score=93.11 TRINITY_DN7418_c0_g1_i2:71-1072(+)